MIGLAEIAVVGVILVTSVGIPALVVYALHVWARKVAAQIGTVWYRRLRWLPLLGVGFWVGSLVVTAALVVRAFARASEVAPTEKTRFLAETISETVNASALIGLGALLCFVISALTSAIGSSQRRPPR